MLYEMVDLICLSLINPKKQHPFYFQLREDSNSAHDFVKYVFDAIKSGYIGGGDFLVVDNVRMHSSSETWELLNSGLDRVGASLAFLPASRT